MAEALVLVCDLCGRPAVETVKFRIGNRNLEKDYCAAHLQELEAGARRPRRGRKPATVLTGPAPSGKRRGRPPGSKNKNPSGNGRRKPRADTSK
jgi:hypothetical protein